MNTVKVVVDYNGEEFVARSVDGETGFSFSATGQTKGDAFKNLVQQVEQLLWYEENQAVFSL